MPIWMVHFKGTPSKRCNVRSTSVREPSSIRQLGKVCDKCRRITFMWIPLVSYASGLRGYNRRGSYSLGRCIHRRDRILTGL